MLSALQAAATVGLSFRRARIQRGKRMSPPERVVEGVRLALTPLLNQDCAPSCGAASDYVVGLRLALLKAARDAGDTAVAPGSLRAEARGAIRPLLERLALEGTEAFLGSAQLASITGLAGVTSVAADAFRGLETSYNLHLQL